MLYSRAPHPRMRHSSPKKHRQVPRGSRVSVEELRGALTYLLQLPRCRNGNAWFFRYFFFFGFFFAFGTEITCRSNVAIAGLTLPTARSSIRIAWLLSALSLHPLLPTNTSPAVQLEYAPRFRHVSARFPFFSRQGDLFCSVHAVGDS
jgi:hypothetical protein